MIPTLLHVTFLQLSRDRVALGLTFLLPIVFFSIFASVFASMDPGSLRPVEATVAVAEDSPLAVSMAERLANEPRLVVQQRSWDSREDALDDLRRGRTAVVILLPPDLRPSLAGPADNTPAVEIHADRSNPLASGLVEGLVQSAAAATAVVSLGLPMVTDAPPLPVRSVDALGRTGKRPSIAFFAAGLGVMFLMFAVTGRGSIWVEERENGILRRLLTTRVGLMQILAARWLFLTVLGATQVTVMFLWAAFGFGLDLFSARSLLGFAAVTGVTAAAAAAFGLLLASLCRTRAQLNGVAVVVVLTLCALGGNMFPSFLMPERLQSIGSLTFNAWALQAYQKIFWYELPLVDVTGELTALGLVAMAFFGLAVHAAKHSLASAGGGR